MRHVDVIVECDGCGLNAIITLAPGQKLGEARAQLDESCGRRGWKRRGDEHYCQDCVRIIRLDRQMSLPLDKGAAS